MAYFAKKMEYCANETSFVALVMIAKKKGGNPVKFVLYKYAMNYGAKMVEFNAEQEETAIKSFPYGPIIFEDIEENRELQRLGLPRCRKKVWQKTTDWLYEVGAGGAYQMHSDSDWVKVGKPAIWKNRRKKMRPKFGELGHLLIIRQLYLRDLRRELSNIKCDLDDIVLYYEDGGEAYLREDLTTREKDRVYELKLEIERVEHLISATEGKISALKAEMKFKRNNRR